MTALLPLGNYPTHFAPRQVALRKRQRLARAWRGSAEALPSPKWATEPEWGPVGEAGRTRGAGGVGGQVGREQKHSTRPSGATGEVGKAERRRAAGQRGKAAKLRRLSSPTLSTPKWVPHSLGLP